MSEPLLTPREAAAYLQVAVQTLAKWRWLQLGPPFRKVGRRLIRYAKSDLEAWEWQLSPAHDTETPAPLPAPQQPASHIIALPPRRRRQL